MSSWDLQEARSLLRQRFGQEQFNLATHSLGSTVDRREYARFHYHEAKDIIDTRLGTLQEQQLFLVMLGGGTDDEQNEYEDSLVQLGAHVVACVQSLHAIADTFAHAIYFSLGYNLHADALDEHKVTANSVKKKLHSAHVRLAEGLGELISHPNAKYLRALANQSKHRSLVVKPGLWLDMTGLAAEPFTLKFQDFRYEDEFHARREIRPFLESSFNQISRIVVDTGAELNVALRAQLA